MGTQGKPRLVSDEVIKHVVQQLPRMKWSSCFAKVIREEIQQKPWCHTTAIEGFEEAVAGNKLMEPYE